MRIKTRGRVTLKVDEEEGEVLKVEAHPISLKGRQEIKRRWKETQILEEDLEVGDLMGDEGLEEEL